MEKILTILLVNLYQGFERLLCTSQAVLALKTTKIRSFVLSKCYIF
jgi:hypothetical protein